MGGEIRSSFKELGVLPYDEAKVQVTVRMIPLELLLSIEGSIVVKQQLIDSYSKNIDHILNENPLRVWVDEEIPTEVKRVIDGLHRISSAQRANKIYDAGITHVPCKLEVLTEREFLRRRREQTMNHEEISDFRCVKWLKEKYEEKGFEIPLLKILNFYYSTAENKGRNFLFKYNISEQRLGETKKFVDEWVKDFDVPGRRAQQAYKALELIGIENFDIVGLPGVNVDIIMTTYGSLRSIEDSDYKREVANHILRVCAGTERMRGKVQNIARVFSEGTEEYKNQIMSIKSYFNDNGNYGGETIYERFKREIGFNRLEKPESKKTKISTNFRKQNSKQPILDVDIEIQKVEPGNKIYDFKSGETGVLFLLSGGGYVISKDDYGDHSFYRIAGPHIFEIDEDIIKYEEPIVYSGGNIRQNIKFFFHKKMDEVKQGINFLYSKINEESHLMREASAKTISFLLERHHPIKVVAKLMLEDHYYSNGKIICGVPFNILDFVRNYSTIEKVDVLAELGGSVSLVPNKNYLEINNLVRFRKRITELTK